MNVLDLLYRAAHLFAALGSIMAGHSVNDMGFAGSPEYFLLGTPLIIAGGFVVGTAFTRRS